MKDSLHLVAHLSDTHAGRKTVAFNSKEFDRCFDVYTKNLIDSAKILKNSHTVDEVTIVLGGDIVDGEEIFRGQAYELEFKIDEQKKVASEAIYRMTDSLKPYFRRINILGIRGNHGVANRNGSSASNWDFALYEMLEQRFKGDRRVNLVIEKSWHHILNVMGHKILIAHGDEIRPGGDTPYTSIAKRVMKWYTGGTFGQFELCLLGHLHTDYQIRAGKIGIYGNGCFVADDDYSLKYGFFPSRVMHIFGVTKKAIPEVVFKVDLDGI